MSDGVLRRDFLGRVCGAGIGIWGTGVRAAAPERSRPSEQLGWQLACNAYSFNRLTLHETIGRLAALGLRYTVGFNWQRLGLERPGIIFNEEMAAADRRETKKRLDDAGVKMPACYCRTLAEADACRRVFDFCRDMEIEMIDGEPPFEAYDMLERLCDEYRINLAVHNHAKPSPYWQPETLIKIFQGRGPRVGACCDTGHWIRSGLPTAETLAKFEGRLLTLDLKDLGEDGFCVPYGMGKGDIRGVLKELHRQHFRGLIGIEYGQRSANGEAEITQCAAFVEQVCAELCAAAPPKPA